MPDALLPLVQRCTMDRNRQTMRFRTQLMLLMLGLSVLPMLAVRTYGIHNVRTMGEALLVQVSLVEQEALSDRTDTGVQRKAEADARFERLRAHIQQRVRRIEHLTAFFLTVLTVLAVLLCLLFARRITSRIDKLVHTAHRLASGDFDTSISIDSKDEFSEIARVFNSIGPRLKDHYRIQQAIIVTTEVQRRLLPLRPPALDGIDIDAMTLYNDEIGGDYYDYLCTGTPERICVAVGDVSGHGLPAALLMADVRGMLHLRAAMPGSLESLLIDVNRQFAKDMEVSCQFMSLLLLRIDSIHRRIDWVRAGHNPGLLYDPEQDRFEELIGEGPPLGLWEDARFEENTRSVSPGQILLLFSDGIVEARNPQDLMFGKERLMDVIRENASCSAKVLVLSVLDAVTNFCGEADPDDDMTVMAIRFQEEGGMAVPSTKKNRSISA